MKKEDLGRAAGNALWCSYTHPATTLAHPTRAQLWPEPSKRVLFKAQPPGTAADAKRSRAPVAPSPLLLPFWFRKALASTVHAKAHTR